MSSQRRHDTATSGQTYTRRQAVGLAGGLAAGLLVLGKSAGASAESAVGRVRPGSAEGGSLNFGLFAEPDGLDPARMRLISSYYVAGQIYDQLLWRLSGGEATEYLPGLALDYEISDDGTEYTFQLRDGVEFHDGTPFDASAVQFTFDRLIDPATESVKAKVALGTYTHCTVVDPLTVTVHFERPNGSFLNNVAGPLLGIVSPTAAAKGHDELMRSPVGTGPFKFKSWRSGESIELERNEAYTWGPPLGESTGPAKLEGVNFRIIVNSPAQANALRTDALQVAQGMAIADLVQLGDGFQRDVVPSSGGPFGFMLNTQKFPTDDVLVRQAIQYGADTAALRAINFMDVYEPAHTVTTSATFAHDSEPTYSYDPAKAAELLDEAGWVMGDDGVRTKDGQPLELSFLLFGGFGWKDPATLLASQLETLGFRSQIAEEPPSSALPKSQEGVMNVSGYSYADPDPYFMKNLFSCSQAGTGSNFSHFCDPEVDAAIDAANETVDVDERIAAYQAIQQKLMEEAVFVPVYDYAVAFASAENVEGLAFTTLAVPVLTAVTA